MEWTSTARATDAVVVIDDGPIRRIVLNRPDVNNAINQVLTDRLEAALDEFDARDDLRVAVIGANGRNFCAGMDLREFSVPGSRSVAPAGSRGSPSARLPSRSSPPSTERYSPVGSRSHWRATSSSRRAPPASGCRKWASAWSPPPAA